MIRKLRRNITCWQDFRLFYRIFALITMLPALIKWHTLPCLLARLTPENKNSSTAPGTDQTEAKIIKYTDFILGWNIGVWKQTCLKRSLVLYHFLRGIGMPVQICFGIRLPFAEGKDVHGQLEGHAWLLYHKDLFLEIEPEMTATYTETYRYPMPHWTNRYTGRLGTVTQ